MGFSDQNWQAGMERLRGDRLFGRLFVASAAKLREIAERLGVRRLVNLVGCPLRWQHPESRIAPQSSIRRSIAPRGQSSRLARRSYLMKIWARSPGHSTAANHDPLI
jgi:hypothetical protein